MNRGKKTKRTEMEKRWAEQTRKEKETQAENRRRLLKSLDPETAEYTRQQFAKLGLTQ